MFKAGVSRLSNWAANRCPISVVSPVGSVEYQPADHRRNRSRIFRLSGNGGNFMSCFETPMPQMTNRVLKHPSIELVRRHLTN
jgi:hypothetical protein